MQNSQINSSADCQIIIEIIISKFELDQLLFTPKTQKKTECDRP